MDDIILPDQDNFETKAGGDGDLDLLGYGYDGTGRLFHPASAKAKVVDVTKFRNENPARVEKNLYTSTNSRYIIGTNSRNYVEKVSGSSDISFVYDLKNNFSQEIIRNSSNGFCSYFIEVAYKNIFLNSDFEMLGKYITDEFKNDLFQYAVEDKVHNLINKYGTHVLADIVLGGRLNVIYKSNNRDNSTTREESIKAGFSGVIGKLINVNIGGSNNQSLIEKNSYEELVYYTQGGDPSKSIIDRINPSGSIQNISLNVSNWQNSCNSSNCILINSGELIPLWQIAQGYFQYEVSKIENFGEAFLISIVYGTMMKAIQDYTQIYINQSNSILSN